MSEILTSPQFIEVDKIPECTFCKEVAFGQTKDNIPLCDIKGNHPEYDSEELIPYKLKQK